MTIAETQSVGTAIVIQQAISTTDFKIVEVHESIQNGFVRADVELGPFTTVTNPDGSTTTRGSSRRGVMVWEGDAYIAVRDTWVNADLLSAVNTILSTVE